jgi:tetrahydromethanopterin S-methyltransferase subunit G
MDSKDENNNIPANIWFSLDFETIKNRIDAITNQLNKVLPKFEAQTVSDLKTQIPNQDDSL